MARRLAQRRRPQGRRQRRDEGLGQVASRGLRSRVARRNTGGRIHREAVAQSVEHRTFNPLVLGSSPSSLTWQLSSRHASLSVCMRPAALLCESHVPRLRLRGGLRFAAAAARPARSPGGWTVGVSRRRPRAQAVVSALHASHRSGGVQLARTCRGSCGLLSVVQPDTNDPSPRSTTQRRSPARAGGREAKGAVLAAEPQASDRLEDARS